MRKELNIMGKKYLKNYWNNILFLLSTGFLFTMCTYKANKGYKDMLIDSTELSPFVAINIEYKDSIYRVVPREGDMYLFSNNEITNKKYRYELFPIILDKVLNIDSITFYSLKEMDCMVIPQLHIDSLYNGRIENLISSFFNDKGILSTTLSRSEEKYLIYLLFKHGIYLNTDCETGALFIVNNADQ